ncbi:MAG: N-acetylmuramoyl-L-alanine amidase [Clostridia bacterium]|nr:N-acetylmuramoyl-L-alanine amidase [Clostridia bacterium]
MFSESAEADADSTVKIIIDAGHGGVDGGVSGVKTGVKESDLNLEYAVELKRQAEESGFKVVLTRSTSAGLYGTATKNLKKKEMLKRKEIIEREAPNVVLSLHMNYYAVSSRRGAQVFYKKGDEQGERLATAIQSRLNGMDTSTRSYSPLTGDYYILNCTKSPSVIVECGFLSSPDDEALLTDKSYREKLCAEILCGIVAFF